MCRIYVLWISLVGVGALLAGGGCGRPAAREPAASPPTTATGKQTPSVPEKTSVTGGDQAATTDGLKELSAEDRAAAEKTARLSRQRRIAWRDGKALQDHRPGPNGLSLLLRLRIAISEEPREVFCENEE